MLKHPRIAVCAVLLLAACAPTPKTDAVHAQQEMKRGYALINAGKPEEAVGVFDSLIAAQPDNPAAYDGKGVAFDHAGNHLAAQDIYQHALSLAPDSVAIRNNLAMSLILNGQTDDAISLLEELNDRHPGNRTVRQNLALAYGITGRTKQALALNLQDMPPEQAQENMKFYKTYALHLKKLKTADLPKHSHIGFSEAQPEQPAESDRAVEATPAVKPVEAASSAPKEETKEAPAYDNASAPAPAAQEAIENKADDAAADSSAFPSQHHSITY